MKTLEPTGRRMEPRAMAWLQLAQIGVMVVLVLVVGLTGYVVAGKVQTIQDYQRLQALNRVIDQQTEMIDRARASLGPEAETTPAYVTAVKTRDWYVAEADRIVRRHPEWAPPDIK
jgi:uncharacterized protein HemX